MDLIEKLPSSSRFNTILVIINWLTKQAIFISAHNTIMFMNLTHLFILHMFSKHSVSSHVTSNKSLEFVLNFFCTLSTTLDVWLHFTSDYHPKGNRQTEYMNQTLKQYLHVYCNYQHDNWSKLLSLMKLLTTMLQVLLLVSFHSLLIRDIIQHHCSSWTQYCFLLSL